MLTSHGVGRAEHEAREDHMFQRRGKELLLDILLTISVTLYAVERLEGIRHPDLGPPPAQQAAVERPASTVAALP